MRLIDADNLIKDLQRSRKYHAQNSRENSLLERCENIVCTQITAYDVDKVMEQLEEQKNNYKEIHNKTYCKRTETDNCNSCRADHYLDAKVQSVDKAIQIVKAGGVYE